MGVFNRFELFVTNRWNEVGRTRTEAVLQAISIFHLNVLMVPDNSLALAGGKEATTARFDRTTCRLAS